MYAGAWACAATAQGLTARQEEGSEYSEIKLLQHYCNKHPAQRGEGAHNALSAASAQVLAFERNRLSNPNLNAAQALECPCCDLHSIKWRTRPGTPG
jgi:hypothetical protein